MLNSVRKSVNRLIKPSNKKVLRDFIENGSRSILTIASITIGVFAVGMIGSGLLLIRQGMAASYADNFPAHITITTDGFDEGFVEMIERQPGVRNAEGRRTLSLEVRNPGEENWKTLFVSVIQEIEEPKLKILKPIQGTSRPDKRSLLVLADGNEKIGSRIGSDLELKLRDGTIQSFQVAGLVKDYTGGREVIMETRRAYVSKDALPFLHEEHAYDTLIVRVEGDPYDLEYIQSVAIHLNNKVENSRRTVYTTMTNTDADQPFRNYVEAIDVILLFIGLLVIVLSSSLIFNTMNALMAQHVRQIGVMKLIGAERRKIVFMYISLVLIFGVISLLIAVPLGAIGGSLMSRRLVPILNGYLINTSVIPLFPPVIILQAFVSLIIPLIAALIPILQGSRISIQKAFDSQKVVNGGTIQSLDKFVIHFSPKDLIKKLSLRNTFRKKGRLILTLFTLSLGGSMFIAVFNVQLVLFNQIDRIISYDSADIGIAMAKEYRVEEIKRVTESIDGVNEVEAWWTSPAVINVDGQVINVDLIAPPINSDLVNKETTFGRWILPNELNTLVASDAFYNVYPDLGTGDVIPLEIDGKTQDWTVVGIYNYTGFDLKRAYVSPESLMKNGSDPFHSHNFRVKLDEQASLNQKDMMDQIQSHFNQQGFDIMRIYYLQDNVETPKEKINVLILVLLIMAIITGTVGGIGLSGTLSLNVLERTGEIGILRAIGAGDRNIFHLVLQEGIIIGLISYFLGLLLSFPVTKILGTIVVRALFTAPAKMVITPRGYIYWLLLTAVLCVGASLVPARSAARMTIRDVLSYE